MTREEAALLLGVSDRTFRRYLVRYEEKGMEGIDQRLGQVSHRCAPVDEVMALADLYSRRYRGFSVKHFYSWYRREDDRVTFRDKRVVSEDPNYKEVFRSVTISPGAAS